MGYLEVLFNFQIFGDFSRFISNIDFSSNSTQLLILNLISFIQMLDYLILSHSSLSAIHFFQSFFCSFCFILYLRNFNPFNIIEACFMAFGIF